MQKAHIPEGSMHRLDENKVEPVTETESAKQKLAVDIAAFLASGRKVEVVPSNHVSTKAKARFNNSQITSAERRRRIARDSEGRFV